MASTRDAAACAAAYRSAMTLMVTLLGLFLNPLRQLFNEVD